jgi:hypothetical protein
MEYGCNGMFISRSPLPRSLQYKSNTMAKPKEHTKKKMQERKKKEMQS